MAGKILIVDDEMDTISYLRLALAPLNFEVIPAINGTEALLLAQSQKPDLIILDVMMPDLDGFEVTRRLRASSETSNIPILMFTAKTQITDKIAGFNSGVDIYLTKPVHTVELQANVKALLAHRQKTTTGPLEKHYVIGVLGTKGGLGVSTLVLNLALALAQKSKKNIIAVELRPGSGIWSIELNLPNSEGLANILRKDPSEITSACITEQLVKTPYGIRVLLASNKPSDAGLISNTSQRDIMLQQLPQIAPYVLLDIGTHVIPAFDALVDICDEIILVTEPQPITVRLTKIIIDELKDKGFGTEKLLSVVTINRTRADMILPQSQIEAELGQPPILGMIPATEQAFVAARKAIPLINVQPDGITAKQFAQLAEIVDRHFENMGK
jgi:pilus assembly protein CpaE